MSDLIGSLGGMLAAFVVAVIAITGMGAVIHLSSKQHRSYLVYFAVAILWAMLVTSLMSGRDLSQPQLNKRIEHPLVSLANWMGTLYFLVASFERMSSRFFNTDRSYQTPMLLMGALVLFWMTNVGSPAFLGYNTQVKHEYFYVLLIGIGMVLSHPEDWERALRITRNALVAFWIVSLLAVLISRNLTLESNYTKSLLGGLPRYAGLATGAVSMGSITLTGLLCLWAKPFDRRWLQILAWGVGLGTFLLAQSKTTWLTFFACAMVLSVYNYGSTLFGGLRDRQKAPLSIALLSGIGLGVLGLAALLAFGNIEDRLDAFENTKAGADMMSLTGRDGIWRVAVEEFQRHPVFGYGQKLFSEEYREMIGMTFATHGHSQFYDTLGRAGMVGIFGLVVFALVMLYYAIRNRHVTHGLSLVFYIVIAVRATSEVPLSMWSYGPELLPVFLLILMCLADPTREPAAPLREPLAPAPVEPTFHTGMEPTVPLGLDPLGPPAQPALGPQVLRY